MYCLIGFLLLTACNKEPKFERTMLLGDWRGINISFNGEEGNSENGWINFTSFLRLEEEGFILNFATGPWNISEDQLILDAREVLGVPIKKYTIVQLTDNQLILESLQTEGEFCCDFEEFSSSEKILIRQEFERL